MTEYSAATDGTRLRAEADLFTYDSAPPEARDPNLPSVIHYWLNPVVNGTSTDGALWALSWSLSWVFGDFLGGLLEQATLQNVERWNGSTWESVA